MVSTKQSYQWTALQIAEETLTFIENNVIPMLQRHGVSDKIIASLLVKFTIDLSQSIRLQYNQTKPSFATSMQIQDIREAVERLYKQYATGKLPVNEFIDSMLKLVMGTSTSTTTTPSQSTPSQAQANTGTSQNQK